MKYLVIITILTVIYGQSLVCLPNGHHLTALIDKGFARMDHDHNGDLNLVEYETRIEIEDTNNDTKVSLEEYLVGASSREIEEALFHHYDHNQDNLLEITDIVLEFHEMDQDSSGIVTRHEFEQYYTKLMHHLFGHQHCGEHNTIVG